MEYLIKYNYMICKFTILIRGSHLYLLQILCALANRIPSYGSKEFSYSVGDRSSSLRFRCKRCLPFRQAIILKIIFLITHKEGRQKMRNTACVLKQNRRLRDSKLREIYFVKFLRDTIFSLSTKITPNLAL